MPLSPENLKFIAEQFPVNDQCMYLNHAAVAPWPKCTSDAVQKFAIENCQTGAQGYLTWLKKEQDLRSKLAKLVGSKNEDCVALVKNTSEALSLVAYGLNWQAGDIILISDDEFPSNRIVWESLAHKFGVIVKQVHISAEDPEKEILAAINTRTSKLKPKLISISAVQYASGIKLDLAKLGKACKENGVLFCVDAIQAVGAMEFKCDEWHIDFAMADGHKWMLGAEGLGFFFVKQNHIQNLNLYQYGWHMIEGAGDFSIKDWQPANNARRFECGSPNMLAGYALEASTDLLLHVGLNNVAQAIENNHSYLLLKLQELGATILSPLDSSVRAGILTFTFPGIDSAGLYQALMKNDVVCANRGGGVRFSPHFHTTKDCMNRAIEVLAQLIKSDIKN
ncbi:MAG: aminotransferase class V-fold PLP-dependent enzyme [Oleispira sp.]|nr:aminotransferase class V-fold PLP-dependent enzyme [Oleispira sp.]